MALRIGVMLRHLGSPGGIGVYTVNVLNALLTVDRENQYVLLHNSSKHLGRFSGFPNVTEKILRAPNPIWWDQITVPRFAESAGLDLIYNPKLSVPLLTRRKTVLVMHGAEQFAAPWAFKWYDRAYFTIANRLYCKRASVIISMTHIGAKDISRYMGADPGKIRVINESYNERCCLLDNEQTQPVKEKYALPDQFILFVGGISPLKNLGNVLRAYQKVQESLPHKLVIVGFKRWKYEPDLALVDQLGIRDNIVFTGFVDDEEIVSIYNLAGLLVFPSLYEGFGIPVLEAMACGCPVIASKTGCSSEVVGDAGVLVDPYNSNEIAESIKEVLTNQSLREGLIAKGLDRSKDFSWNKCARETLQLMESLGKS